MNAKKSLYTLAEAMIEMGGKAPRSLVIDMVLGNESNDIKLGNWQELESFGSGDDHDEEHYNMVIDEAIKQKFITEKGVIIVITAKGKRAARDAETPFIISEGEEEDDQQPDMPKGLGAEQGLEIDDTPHDAVGSRSKLKIKLIQAIDRKVALDDFAQQQSVDFHKVLDLIESMKQSGRSIDINYFLEDLLEKEDIQELYECFEDCNGDLQAATEELSDVYSPEEIRLAYLQWKR